MQQIKLPKPLTWEEIQNMSSDQRVYYVYNLRTQRPLVSTWLVGSAKMRISFATEYSTAFYLTLEDADYMKQLFIEWKLYFNSETRSWELKGGGITEDLESTVATIKESIAASEQYDSILLEAHSIVNGSRKADYKGTEGFEKISAVWNILYPNKPLTAYDVAMLMVILKTVRESVTPKRDNTVDACGYLHFVDLLRDGRSE